MFYISLEFAPWLFKAWLLLKLYPLLIYLYSIYIIPVGTADHFIWSFLEFLCLSSIWIIAASHQV